MLPKPPAFDHWNLTAFIPVTTPPAVLGLFPASLPRPALAYGFVVSSPTWLLGTDPTPAGGRVWPESLQRPKAPVFDHQNETLYVVVVVAPPIPGSAPDSLPKPLRLAGFVVQSPVWLLGTDRPAFGTTWPDVLIAASPTQNIGTDLPPFGRNWPDVMFKPTRPVFDHLRLLGLYSAVLRDLSWVPGVVQIKWLFGTPFGKWSTGSPRSKWRLDQPQE
jgi:hypothetical protein